MSFGRNFALATGRTPSTWSDWDMYSVILIAFVTAFFDLRRFL
nr:MAG TPA: Na, K-ATPase alpha subunit,Na+,K+-ATPase beta PROTEIN, ION PUMP, ATPASE [Caudoviricetes sp.]